MHSPSKAHPLPPVTPPSRRSQPAGSPAQAHQTTSRTQHPTHATPATVWRDGREFLEIADVDRMAPFLMSIVSDSDLWLYVGSNGGMTAGRIDPDHALFAYRTADQILDQPAATGVFCRIFCEGTAWTPWAEGVPAAGIRRHLYKHATGTSVIFEERNEILGLVIEWELWASETFGLMRRCRLRDTSGRERNISILDGWHQLLPSGVSRDTYARYSYLAAAYMRHEASPGGPLALYTLNSGITDRAEPSESLRAAAGWSIGLDDGVLLLSHRQVDAWMRGHPLHPEFETRGVFGSHLRAATVPLAPEACHEWFVAADTRLDHAAIVALKASLQDAASLRDRLATDLEEAPLRLRRRVAGADALQQTADTTARIHHFANVLFNCMRGGTLHDNHRFPRGDFDAFLGCRNAPLRERSSKWLAALPDPCSLEALAEAATAATDPDLRRLAGEYLPLCFSRRHGDPSRPWNRFEIRTRDASGKPVFAHAGNWRDIFQNWEALAYSYPACFAPMIDTFLNASTADGYNPYRITREGVDWEVLDPADPWSHIGYWGDHQIVYLLRLLEGERRFHPGRLSGLLHLKRHCHVDVPYEILGFDDLVRDPKHSIRFDAERHRELVARAEKIGGDGRLLTDASGAIVRVNLAEKLLIPLLVKLGNLVPGGGIWLNTQRPEWNDANNALAGWGLSVVTVCHMRRHVVLLKDLFASETIGEVELTRPVAQLLREISNILPDAAEASIDDCQRHALMERLGRACERHRMAVYRRDPGEHETVATAEIAACLDHALAAIDSTLATNRRSDGMIHSYNILRIAGDSAGIGRLDLMLEGQVAVLASGWLEASEALALLKAMRRSPLYRADQQSYLLYPDRDVTSFLDRNHLPSGWRDRIPATAALLDAGNRDLLCADSEGGVHFQPDLANARQLADCIDALTRQPLWKAALDAEREALLELWEEVFHHASFTGRSGAMFGFEGLGSIYWHMVAKLLLAVQEVHAAAAQADPRSTLTAELARTYHEVRLGLGYRKDAATYGAFPTDPYSHTPAHSGAQQPGMTGQVKEEILTRLGELGVSVRNGQVRFDPHLLERTEFFTHPHRFEWLNPDGSHGSRDLEAGTLAFTLFQVPVIYQLGTAESIEVHHDDERTTHVEGNELPASVNGDLFARNGRITTIVVTLDPARLQDTP